MLRLFGAVEAGGTGSRVVVLSNEGYADLVIAGLELVNSPAFFITHAPYLPATFEPGQSEDVGITFAPTLAGDFTGLLLVHSNDLPWSDQDRKKLAQNGPGSRIEGKRRSVFTE